MTIPLLTREQIVAAALSLEGVPFKRQGRDETIGIDCAGVLVAAFRKLGVELQEERIDYRSQPAEVHVKRCLDMNFDLSPHSDTVFPGDILHLKFNRDTEARHLGIFVETSHPMLVHAVKTSRAVILDLFPLANASIAGIYQWPRLQS